MPSAFANVSSGATLSGNGSLAALYQMGIVKPGNSIGTLNLGGYTTADGAIYNVEINPTESSQILVTNDTTLNGTYNINVLMDAGTYEAGVTDYTILTTGGTLEMNTINVQWNTQPGLTVTVGVLAGSGTAADGKDLILRYTATQAFTINADQTSIDTTTLGTTYDSASFGIDSTITVGANDSVGSNSGLTAPDSAVSVAEQPELTALVFQSTSTSVNEVSSGSVKNEFRFKGLKPSQSALSGGKNSIEGLLSAISQNGPISIEKNETRLWITPFANRSRVAKTNSNSGSQGWSGGSLFGLEQRDQKNTWSLGLMGGLMGSRSHTLGTPDTFSKTNGFLFGGYNTYKYTDYKDAGNFGHEILLSRTVTSIDSQRSGISKTDNKTPYYALASYKTTTDIGNAQLNYLFDIIKKSVTSRLSVGATYTGTQTGAINERNAAAANLNTTTSSTNRTTEYYAGIGFRKIWNHEKITVRTTFVYEYGYQATSAGKTAQTASQNSLAPNAQTLPIGPRQNKHYLQLNGSYLDRNSGIKFITSYSAVLYKNVQNHTAMFKVEYRF